MRDIERSGIGSPQLLVLRRKRIDERPEDEAIEMVVEHSRPSWEMLDNLQITALKHLLKRWMMEDSPPFVCFARFPDTPPPGTAFYELKKFVVEEYKSDAILFGDDCVVPPPGQVVSLMVGRIDLTNRNEASVQLQAQVPRASDYAVWHMKLHNRKGVWKVHQTTVKTAIPAEWDSAREVCRIVDQSLTDHDDYLSEWGSPKICFPDEIDIISIHL